MSEVFLRLSQVRLKTGLSRSSIYAAQKAGTFPKSIALGARAIAWCSSEIDQWIADRIAASRGDVTQK
jgi:prophage regulatory protein